MCLLELNLMTTELETWKDVDDVVALTHYGIILVLSLIALGYWLYVIVKRCKTNDKSDIMSSRALMFKKCPHIEINSKFMRYLFAGAFLLWLFFITIGEILSQGKNDWHAPKWNNEERPIALLAYGNTFF